jgi:hypothetical protein
LPKGDGSSLSKCHPCHPSPPTWPPSPRAGRGPPDPPHLVGKVHLQRHQPLRPRRLRLDGRGGAERCRARKAAATVPPVPRCLPNAVRRRGGLFAHAEACGFGHRSRHRTPIRGSIKVRVPTRAKGRCECCRAGCFLANPDPVTPGHCLVIPRRHGSDGVALHQPEWNAAVEPIAKRMHMSYVGKRFIGAEFTDVQCLTTNAFRFSSMRTWVSNSRFNSGGTRSIRVVRFWSPMLPVATIKSLAGVPCKR